MQYKNKRHPTRTSLYGCKPDMLAATRSQLRVRRMAPVIRHISGINSNDWRLGAAFFTKATACSRFNTSHYDSPAIQPPTPVRSCQHLAARRAVQRRTHVWYYSPYRRAACYIDQSIRSSSTTLFLYRKDFLSKLSYLPSLLLSAFCNPPNWTISHSILQTLSIAHVMPSSAEYVYAPSSRIRGRILS